VPAAAHTAKLKIRPGDTVSASVVVNGHRVRLRIADVTRGTLLVKRLRASAVDTSSAEWIVEAPAVCAGIQASDANCRATALANFGTTRVSRARATTTRGHTGTISDAAWSATAISLVPEFGDPRFDRAASIGQATPEDLSAAGDAFSVVYAASE
jgi:hypothetical protein